MNWLTYIYGIAINRVLDASLGYFLSPLVGIVLARIFVAERINQSQLIAVIIAALGVLWLAILSGDFPWIAIVLSSTWGIYSIFRKKASLSVILGALPKPSPQWCLLRSLFAFFNDAARVYILRTQHL